MTICVCALCQLFLSCPNRYVRFESFSAYHHPITWLTAPKFEAAVPVRLPDMIRTRPESE